MKLTSTGLEVTSVALTDWNEKNLGDAIFEPEQVTQVDYSTWVKLTYNVTYNSSAWWIFDSSFDVANVAEMAVLENTGSRAINEPQAVTPALTYQFSTTGEHTVYVKFADMTKIPDDAFPFTGLTSVVFPESVTEIGRRAFFSNPIKELTIGSGVQTIGGGAFSECHQLTEISIPDGVKTIESGAFNCCSEVKSVTIGSGVTSIAKDAFGGYLNCLLINVATGNTVYDSRNNCNAIMETATNTLIAGCTNTIIPEDTEIIEKFAFSSCDGLTGELVIPNSVTTIGEWAFSGCSGLASVTIGSGIQTIGDKAFEYCEGLAEVTIGSGVKTIGQVVFYGCNNLQKIKIFATVAPVIYYDTFNFGLPGAANNGILYVPQGATGYDTWLTKLSSGWTMQEITGE